MNKKRIYLVGNLDVKFIELIISDMLNAEAVVLKLQWLCLCYFTRGCSTQRRSRVKIILIG